MVKGEKMGKGRALVNKLKRRKKYLTSPKAVNTVDKIDLKDEKLANSPRAYKLMEGIKRRLDDKWGQQLQPSPEKTPNELLVLADLTGVLLTAATATLNLTADIILTSVAKGTARNTTTFTTQVLAAAPNTDDEVLVSFTGTSAAITCTITPNDGTNNSLTPVDLTTEDLVELINTGAVTGKNVVLTDSSSLRALQTATGGDTTPMADAGEGDAVTGTFSGGLEGSLEAQLASGIVRAAGLIANDIVKFYSGSLEGYEATILTVDYDFDIITLEYLGVLSGSESGTAVKLQLSGVKKSFY